MTINELCEMLRKNANAARTWEEYAASLGISDAYLHNVIRGKQEPGPKILAALRLKKVVNYYMSKILTNKMMIAFLEANADKMFAINDPLM